MLSGLMGAAQVRAPATAATMPHGSLHARTGPSAFMLRPCRTGGHAVLKGPPLSAAAGTVARAMGCPCPDPCTAGVGCSAGCHLVDASQECSRAPPTKALHMPASGSVSGTVANEGSREAREYL
jgi:hypothetical protein